MGFVRDHASAIFLSVLVHGAIIALLVVGFVNFREPVKVKPQLAIDATVVDERRVADEMKKLDDQKRADERRAQQEREQAEQAKREREAEEQRLEELRQQREQEEQQEKERAAERAKAAEEDAKRQAAQAKADADRKKKEDAARKKKEVQDARERSVREAELKRQLAEEERRSQAVSAGLLQQYVAQIQAQVQRAWIRPPSARAGLNCVVYVTQVPGGEVTSVRVGDCNGDDIVRQSIEAAVYRASPLPKPSDPALFERNLRLEFRPDE